MFSFEIVAASYLGLSAGGHAIISQAFLLQLFEIKKNPPDDYSLLRKTGRELLELYHRPMVQNF